jgi:hypothetical protein
MKKNKQLLIIFATLCLFLIIFLPNKTQAVADPITMSVGLLPYIQPVMAYFWGIITQLLQGLVFLLVSAFLLQIAVDNSAAWIDVNSLFVKTGLNITTAMADILLIAVFIAIAIGYVFKIDTFKTEKALPKFFITALLIHFAPLFVGMVTDIANIIIKGIMIGKEGIFIDTFIYSLGPQILLSVGALGITFIAAAAAGTAGWLGIAANLGAVTLGVGNLLVGVPIYLTQIMTLNITAGIVFSYAMLFLTRVFVIQILTVLAPLAILSGALPQTKKWFDMWKEWLLGWSFGGILVLFLLTLGLTCLEMIGSLPRNSSASLGFGAQAINLSMDWQFPWIALAIYMMTVESLCLGMIPALAKDFTTKVKEGSSGLKKAGGPLSKNVESRLQDKGVLASSSKEQQLKSLLKE